MGGSIETLPAPLNALHGYFAALFLWPNNKYHPKPYVSDEVLNLFWNAIFHTLYLDYDTSKEFLPQFQKAAETLTALYKGVMEVGTLFPPEQ